MNKLDLWTFQCIGPRRDADVAKAVEMSQANCP